MANRGSSGCIDGAWSGLPVVLGVENLEVPGAGVTSDGVAGRDVNVLSLRFRGSFAAARFRGCGACCWSWIMASSSSSQFLIALFD